MKKESNNIFVAKNIPNQKSFKYPSVLFIKVLFLILSCYGLMNSFGYEFIKIIIIPAMIYSIVTVGYKLNMYKFFLYSIVFLVIFDNDIVNITDFKLRYWYPIVIFLIFIIFLKILRGNFSEIKFSRSIVVLIFFYFISTSMVFLLIEDFASKLYNIKYWIFTIGLIYVLLWLAKKSKVDINELLYFWLFVLMFSNLWGVLQFNGNILGFAGDNLQHDWYNISPSAFFSERTWYGQYSAVGVIVSFYFYLKTKQSFFIFFIFIFFIGVAISYSRSSLIPLFGLFLSLIIALLITRRINIKFMMKTLLALGIVILALSIYDFGGVVNIFSILDKFDNNDTGIQGRYEAIWLFFENVKLNPVGYIFGNGFYWDETQTSSIGTAIGAKAANVFLMIFHIFGIFGLFFTMLLALRFLIYYFILFKSKNEILLLIGFSLYLTFLGLSFTVPAHQFPSSLVILFFSIFIFKIFKEENERLTWKK